MKNQKSRRAEVKRETKETRILVSLNLDGAGRVKVKTPYGFLDHMIGALGKHALFDLGVTASGDTEVDAHHTVEDIGLTLGEAFWRALGDKSGICRFGHAQVPMDEALAGATVDLSGRPLLVYSVQIPERKQWEFDCNLVKEFFQGLAMNGRLTLHLRLEYGDNYHHCCEALFKAAGRALKAAAALESPRKGVPSTKGKL